MSLISQISSSNKKNSQGEKKGNWGMKLQAAIGKKR